MKHKYIFNRQADEYLKDVYKNHKVKSIKNKIKTMEKLLGYKDYTITHFAPKSKEWLLALEFMFLTSRKLL